METAVQDSLLPPDTSPPAPEAVPAPTEPRRRRWGIHLALIGGYPLVIGMTAWLGADARHAPALSSKPGTLLMVCLIELSIFAVVFAGAWLASRVTREELLLQWHGRFRPLILGFGYSVVLRFGVGMVIMIISGLLIAAHLTTTQSMQDFLKENSPDVETIVDLSAMHENPVYFWLTLTFVSFVLAGLREELWRSAFLAGARGLGPKLFSSRSGQVAAAAVAAVIFGFGHLPQGVLAVGMTGLLGFGLGLIMVFHRSIWPAVIAHGVFDASSFILLTMMMRKQGGG